MDAADFHPEALVRRSSLLLPFSLLVLSMIQVGCASFTSAREDNLQRVHEGQSEAEVSDRLGSPDDKAQRDDGQIVWHYQIYRVDNRGSYPYTAYFADGKLVKIQMEQTSYKDISDKNGKRKGSKGFFSVSAHHGTYADPSAPATAEDWHASGTAGTSMFDPHP